MATTVQAISIATPSKIGGESEMGATQYRRDQKLVVQAQAGDARAFGQLYGIYYPYVHNIAYEVLQNTQEAEEITQEVFTKAHGNITTLDNPPGFQKWLSIIARNTCFDYLRKKQRISVEVSYMELEASEMDSRHSMHSAEEEVCKREDRKALYQIIDGLPRIQRTVVILHYMEGLSGEEIARRTNSNLSAVYSSLYKARKALKHRLY